MQLHKKYTDHNVFKNDLLKTDKRQTCTCGYAKICIKSLLKRPSLLL